MSLPRLPWLFVPPTLCILCALCGSFAHAQEKSPRFHLPPGFIIEKVAGPPLVEHPMFACFDERGRLFIAESAGKNLKAADLIKEKPNFIRVLEPADKSGRFTKGHVFADKMTFPMGVCWYDGALFTCSSGALWKLEDSRNKGVADKRTELVKKFGFTGNAADIHGPYLSPDGRLYWCEGRHGHEIKRPDGKVMKGLAARIFRCKPDGSEVEVVCGGGMDNPVAIAFTPEGEPLVTVNILHHKPARNDAIIYAIEGGVWPWHEAYKEFPRTGELLPAAANLGWVAPSGLMRYRSETFGKGYRNNLFSAQFNRGRIQRHIVERDGAGFKIKSEDFLTSTDKNFHPTDVLEDADGSLLVIDTGGWFRIGCPTSQIARPEIQGAIYRIRKKDAKAVKDPRGLRISWERARDPATPLDGLLIDSRFAVRDRAIHESVQRGKRDAGRWLELIAIGSTGGAWSEPLRRNALWALTRMDWPEARSAVRRGLAAEEESIRMVAIHSTGLHREPKAIPELLRIVKEDREPSVRRAAATALGRIGKAEAIPALMEAMPKAKGDRFLEHAIIYALIQIGDRDKTAKYLADKHPAIQRAALIAVDQMPKGNLIAEEIVPLLTSDDPTLQKATLSVIAERPSFGPVIVDLLRGWLARPNLLAGREEIARNLLSGLGKDKAIQQLITDALRSPKTPATTKLLIFEAMAETPSGSRRSPDWLDALRDAMRDKDARLARQAVITARALDVADLDADLLRLGKDKTRDAELRLSALSAVAGRLKKIDDDVFAFLAARLDKKNPPLLRLSAANVLSRNASGPLTPMLSVQQLSSLTANIKTAGALELPALLAVFENASDQDVGLKLAAALEKSPGLSALSPSILARAFKHFPADVQREAARLGKRLEAETGKQSERLTELEPLLKGGDADRGRLVFFGNKASCSACHAVNKAGGNIGPDLSKIAAVRSGRDILEAVIFPSASFARGYEPYVIQNRRGQSFSGILGRETADAVTLITTERTPIRILRADIDTFTPGRVSIMPQELETQLSRDELRDLLAFVQALK